MCLAANPNAVLVISQIRATYGAIEDFIVKYSWSACGYLLISIPVFFGPGAAERIAAAATGSSAKVQADSHAEEGKSIASRTESESHSAPFLVAPDLD